MRRVGVESTTGRLVQQKGKSSLVETSWVNFMGEGPAADEGRSPPAVPPPPTTTTGACSASSSSSAERDDDDDAAKDEEESQEDHHGAALSEDGHCNGIDGDSDIVHHDDTFRVALYYCYVALSDVPKHVELQRRLCQEHTLTGRIRVAPEGLNGVLTGRLDSLQAYESILRTELRRVSVVAAAGTETQQSSAAQHPSVFDLDVKYCRLRPDLPVQEQLFQDLMVQPTRHVVTLVVEDDHASGTGSRRRRKSKRQSKHHEAQSPVSNRERSAVQQVWAAALANEDEGKLAPAPHLSPDEWNERLKDAAEYNGSGSGSGVVFLDCRNSYESAIGHFAAPHASTLLANTRKYSDLPQVLIDEADRLVSSSHIFMYVCSHFLSWCGFFDSGCGCYYGHGSSRRSIRSVPPDVRHFYLSRQNNYFLLLPQVLHGWGPMRTGELVFATVAAEYSPPPSRERRQRRRRECRRRCSAPGSVPTPWWHPEVPRRPDSRVALQGQELCL